MACADGKRFNLPTDEDLAEIMDKKDSKNTKRATAQAVNCLNLFLREIKGTTETSIDKLSPDELDDQLSRFFVGARKTDGTKYKKTALNALRFGIARYVQKNYTIDIINDPRCNRSNDVYKAVIVDLKREGLAAVNHHPAISSDDLRKLYTSDTMSPDNPTGLQHKVWFDVMFYTCRRGRENLRQMDKDTFGIVTDAAGRRFVFQKKDELDKNHRKNDSNQCTDGRMYEWPGHHLCPVTSFNKYLSKLHPGRKDLWQRPKVQDWETNTWYMNSPVGVNTLGHKMQDISKAVQLSRVYTNHSIRTTMVSTLDSGNFEARHIMKISGHKSESSIRSYSHGVTDKQKENMFEHLSKAVVPDRHTSIPDDSDSESIFSRDGDNLISSSQCELILATISGNSSTAPMAPSISSENSSTAPMAPSISSGNSSTAPMAPSNNIQPSSVLHNVLNLPGYNVVPQIKNCVVNFNFNVK